MRRLQSSKMLSESMLWDLQQSYFSEKGVDAWRNDEVPHYVTSNPAMANCYAEIVFAYWLDRQRLVPDSPPVDEPMYILELGADPDGLPIIS
ncbi:hypothetical protein [Cohnella cholangitidis]|uniref:Uncharacterized protein n=1 Tax=Cohnella cholangitidis TaxID=2598458 RepID=A0A7G5C0E3_9BACL|nr:hypothetical protein [Cohnella cholangitidis]QMV42677.1 hypothetical protein FPL14_16885 [Cohnella cholangitidis]